MSLPVDAKFAAFDGERPILASAADMREIAGTDAIRSELLAAIERAQGTLGAVVDVVSAAARRTGEDIAYALEQTAQLAPIAVDTEALKEARARLDKAVEDLFARIDAADGRIEPVVADTKALKEAGDRLGKSVDSLFKRNDVAVEALAALDATVAGNDAARRQIERTAGRLSDTTLQLLLMSDRTQTILRGAGIVVEPQTGIVRINAFDQLSHRTNQAEITLDAQRALIATKVSSTEVDDKILRAVLKPEQTAQLEPLIARIAAVEIVQDALRAEVSTKAELVELTKATLRLTDAETRISAAEGLIQSTVTRTAFDAALIRLASAETKLLAQGDISSFSVELRQARAANRDAGAGLLASAIAASEADNRQMLAQADIRQEFRTSVTGVDDRLTVEVGARLALTAVVGALDARSVQDRQLLVQADEALARDISALGVRSDSYDASIATLQRASLTQAGGIAGIETVVRQQARDTRQQARNGGADALLGSVVAADDAGRRSTAGLVEIQMQLTTTLLAGFEASAVARQALRAQIDEADARFAQEVRTTADRFKAAAESVSALQATFGTDVSQLRATIATLERTTADQNKATAERIDGLRATIADPATGLAKTRADLTALTEAVATQNQAAVRRLEGLEASVNDEAKGLLATTTRLDRQIELTAGRDAARGRQIEALSGEMHHPETGLPAAFVSIGAQREASLERDQANARAIEVVAAELRNPDTGLPAVTASIATLRRASLTQAGGIAGIETVVRQQARDTRQQARNGGADALLGSVVAADDAGRRSTAGLVEIQMQLTTTLLAGFEASAVARQALRAQIDEADARFAQEVRTTADRFGAVTQSLTALQATFGTDVGQLRATIATLERTTADQNKATAERIDGLRATIADPATGLAKTRADLTALTEANADQDRAAVRRLTGLEASVNDPATGLAKTRADLVAQVEAIAERDRARVASIERLDARLSATTGQGNVRANLQRNGGFEAGLEGVAVPPDVGVTDEATGGRIIHWNRAGTTAIIMPSVNVTPNTAYTVSFLALLDVDAGTLRVDAQTWTGRDATGRSTDDRFGLRVEIGSTFDTRREFTFTTPADCASIRLRLISEGIVAPRGIWMARIKVERGPAPATAYSADAQIAASSASVANLREAVAEERGARARAVEQVTAEVGAERGRITSLREVVVGPSGTAVRAVMSLDARGLISGLVQTNDGRLATAGFVADRFGVYSPSGALLFYVDADGAIAANFKKSAIGYDNLAMGAAQMASFWSTTRDIVVARGATTTIITLDIVKQDRDSVLEVMLFANVESPDDLQFTGRLKLDGATVQPTPVNITLDQTNSRGRMPISPFAFLSGIAAGPHRAEFEFTNDDLGNHPLTIRAGATLKVTELRKASIGNATGSSGGDGGGSGSTPSGGTGGGTYDGGTGNQVQQR